MAILICCGKFTIESANTQEKRRKSEVLLQKFSENPKYYFKNSAKI